MGDPYRAEIPQYARGRPRAANGDRSEGEFWPKENLTGCKRVLTSSCDSVSVVAVKPSQSFWEAWDRIRTSADPDPLEVLQLAAAFSRYFDAAQKEAISFRARLGCRGSRLPSPSARADKPCGSVRAETRHCRRCWPHPESGGGRRLSVIPSPGTEKRDPSLPNLQADLVWYCALSRQRGLPLSDPSLR